jgi:hypothetical protein
VAVERAVFKALAKKPAARFATAAQFAEALTGEPTAAFPARPVGREAFDAASVVS